MIDLVSNSMLMGFLTGLIFFSLPTAMLQVSIAARQNPREGGKGSFTA
ncbi:MAG: hypothetical protein ACFHX7_18160 [Pseudomonadota bacterium]